MIFWVVSVVSRAIEIPDRATGQLCTDFPKNENYMFLKIKVKLNGKITVIVETCTEYQKSRHEDIVRRNWLDSKRFGMGMLK
jgi:hypothetical protein